MPGNILRADLEFPSFTGEESQDEKTEKILNYLYMLLESLKYSMANLGVDNFNEKELDGISELVTAPIYVRLEDDEGKIAALTVTAAGLTTRMTDAEGNISTLTVTAAGLTTRMSTAEGNITTAQLTAESITLSVTNNSTTSTIKLMRGSTQVTSQTIQLTGLVSFASLQDSTDTTVINGATITTGTINSMTINTATLNSSVINLTLINGYSESTGKIGLIYQTWNGAKDVGKIDLYDEGSSEGDSKRGLLISTDTDAQDGAPDFALKMRGAGVSIEAKRTYGAQSILHTIWMIGGEIKSVGTFSAFTNEDRSGEAIKAIASGNKDVVRIGTENHGDDIYLWGRVYVNGTLIS